MSRIIYAATPFRMEEQVRKICDFIEEQGCFPLHPLLALPYERFNYERHDRETIYRVCFGLICISDELWIFGIGGGAFKEWEYAKSLGRSVSSFVKRFDSRWEEYSRRDKYRTKYKMVLEEVLRLSI